MYEGLMKDKMVRRPACIRAASWEDILNEFSLFDHKLHEDLVSLPYRLNDSNLENFRRCLSVSEVALLDNYLLGNIPSEPCSWDGVEKAMQCCNDEVLKKAYDSNVSSIGKAALVTVSDDKP